MATEARINRYELKTMHDTANVVQGYKYYFDKLLAYCMNIFKYKNLPESLPKKEIESNLLLTGHCVVFKNESEIVTAYTDLYGFDKYYNPTNAVYAQPRLRSKNLKLSNDKVCILYNCDLENQILGFDVDGGLYDFISRYARMLADIESTIAIQLVNIRSPFMPVSDDDNVRTSVKNFFKKITLGKREVVSDSNIVEQLRSIDLNSVRNNEKIIDLLIARDKIFEMFLRDIGVKFYQPKKAQVNTDEVNASNEMFMISIDDMLLKRQEGIDTLNKKFNLNVSVEINPKWGKGVNNNES